MNLRAMCSKARLRGVAGVVCLVFLYCPILVVIVIREFGTMVLGKAGAVPMSS